MHTERINKVLALVMTANPDLPIPLSTDNMDLDDITSTPKGIRNTQATLYARDTGDVVRYAGNSEIYYDRIDIARYWQKPTLIENPDARTVKDLVAILRNRYGLDVLDSEVVNTDDTLPDTGTVTVMIDDTTSPLYIGQVDVAFAKDAGLSQQDGVAYEVGTLAVGSVLGYTDDPITLECSVNGGRWVTMTRTRNSKTRQYQYQDATNAVLDNAQIRIRGGAVQLMDNTGAYVPLTYLTLYRGSTDAVGYCAGIRSLVGVRAGVFYYRPNLVSADYMFDGCTQLTDLPEHLFSSCLDLVSAKAVLRNTPITQIPANLFESCGKLANLTSAFEQCTRLQAVPDTLFRTNTALTTLKRCFLGCTGLQANPATATLLAPLAQLTDVSYLFAGCVAVTAIPTGFLKKQTLLITVEGLFSQCTELRTIPGDLFTTTTKLNTASRLFEGCAQITGIPPGLFQYTPDLEYAKATFANTGILTTPEVMFTYTRRLISIDQIFANCTQLTVIPPALLQPLLRLQSANEVWRGCRGITAIPTNLLINNTNLVSIVGLFAYTNITAVTSTLLRNTTKVDDYSQLFEGTLLTTVPQSLFSFMTQARRIDRVFFGCVQLTSLPNLLFNWSVNITSALGAFANCSKLNVSINNLFKHLAAPDNNPLTNVRGLFQNCTMVSGTFATLKTEYPNVDWNSIDKVQGCIAGCTRLSDYASAGAIYKTPAPELV